MAKGRQNVPLPRKGKSTHSEKQNQPPPTPSRDPRIPIILRSFAYVVIIALNSQISQLTLAPVYGSLPSSINHISTLTASFILGYVWRNLLSPWTQADITPYTALYMVWMPALQMLLSTIKSTKDPILGPIAQGFLSCHALTFLLAYSIAQTLEPLNLSTSLGQVTAATLPAMALTFILLRPLQWLFAHYLPRSMPTPPLLQLLEGGFLALASHTKPYWLFTLAVPGVLHTFLANPHVNPGVATHLLSPHNLTLLDRSWSKTGYVSVVEDSKNGYRVLRADHSLLGGEWLLTPARRAEGWRTEESIFGAFHLLEAVRLIDTEAGRRDAVRDATALVVGLGAGTAPKALYAHGIDTTVVEVDPVVGRFARGYFGLPMGVRLEVADAKRWVRRRADAEEGGFDYIVHDVFTGGAEPEGLFGEEFLGMLRGLMAPDGAVAVLYAGRLEQEMTQRVLRTVYKVWEEQCRLFRDGDGEEGDFMNLVVFCRNKPGAEVRFREPTERDYLGSRMRRKYLVPREEWEREFPAADGVGEGDVKAQQEENALRHWWMMRDMIPAALWEVW
ncbi:S-adenosyl-L-methionine-dependent methyltransferase [Piedraia hortae CBS 480.64]|uniref:S-adenosyl-L-methionine-dependent methyltransferase n=1 Tax=Piedraia hortae CBS 480.64 TaxID=1314780 RepID=A0A6A7BW23_9PEZI|nr:S-adenosyl-L-methionine-dependent methyltransferase [Piedraia hortae CBS 480.64]